jgi:hypothetical protein
MKATSVVNDHNNAARGPDGSFKMLSVPSTLNLELHCERDFSSKLLGLLAASS